MSSVILTVEYGDESLQTVDIEVPLSVTISQIEDSLREAGLLTVPGTMQYQISLTGESWNSAEGQTPLSEHVFGDGALLRMQAPQIEN